MKRNIITISEGGAVNVPSGKIMMTDFEIAQLLGVMVPTVKGKIKTLLKSRMVLDASGGEVYGNRIIPTHFGLEVVIAIAMQVESYEADIFRKWLLRKATRPMHVPIYVQCDNDKRVIN